MTNQSLPPDIEIRQELEKERDLRRKIEAEASTTRQELLEKEAALEKYKRLPAKLDKYRYRSHKLKRQLNIYRIVSLLLLLAVGYFLIERYQKKHELQNLRNEIKAAGVPERNLPGVITQEAMRRDAERQGGSLEE